MSGETDVAVKAAFAKLEAFDKKLKRSTLRKIGNAQSKIALAVLKANSPKDTGTLRKSQGRVVKVYAAKSAVFWAVGPRTKWRRVVTRKVVKPRGFVGPVKPKVVIRWPTKTAHLVERKTGYFSKSAAAVRGRMAAAALGVLAPEMRL